jgi:putative transposase
VEDERLLERIRELHAANYSAYGYRRTWKALLRAGEPVARCTVQRLMRGAGIQGAKRRGKPWRTTTPDRSAPRRADLVCRDFSAEAPNRLWVADITHLRSWEGVSYLAFILDAFSRMIVGWQLPAHMRTGLVLDALRMALGIREPGADVALVHHSDRGSQYTSADFTQELSERSVLASVGSVGDAYDNAMAESFVDTLKTELIRDLGSLRFDSSQAHSLVEVRWLPRRSAPRVALTSSSVNSRLVAATASARWCGSVAKATGSRSMRRSGGSSGMSTRSWPILTGRGSWLRSRDLS